ncbi:MAG: membrane protein insertion efficiency factor YidD [Thermodesulfovibrionales bacterium]
MRDILLWMIKLYRYLLSPFFPVSCRFNPTCSEYALEAIEKHGVVIGLFLIVKRLSRCHPFHGGGDDPVPCCKNYKYNHKVCIWLKALSEKLSYSPK